MSTNSADATANRAKDDEASGDLVSISPFFIVKDLQTSVAHYRERLGFQLFAQGPDDVGSRQVAVANGFRKDGTRDGRDLYVLDAKACCR